MSLKIFFGLIIVFFSYILLYLLLYRPFQGGYLYDNTIVVFFNKISNSEYTVIEKKYDVVILFADFSGDWHIRINGKLDLSDQLQLNFGLADQYDLEYYKTIVTGTFGEKNLRDYVLYRAETYLGKDTMCPSSRSSHCNVYILYSDNSNDVYVGLSTI